MYCKKCGCRIKSGDNNCPDCGTEVMGIEYNGGFWGLVGGEGTESKNSSIEKLDEDGFVNEKNHKPHRLPLFIILIGVAVIWLIQNLHTVSISKKYDNLIEEHVALKQRYDEVYTKYMFLQFAESEKQENDDIEKGQESIDLHEEEMIVNE